MNDYFYSGTQLTDPNVDITWSNVGTQGYPGVGKTSVLLATGKDPAPTS